LPAAAESWEVSEDGLNYRFILRKNLKYSNGDQITAAHFRDSWLKLMSPDSGNDYGSLLNIIKNGKLYREGKASASDVQIIAESDRVLLINLNQKAPHLTKILCHHSFAPIHPSLLDKKNWNEKNIIVNGPYIFSEKNENYILFEKNENYWDKENVSIEKVKIEFSNEPLENSLLFNRDKIDWLTDRFDIKTLNINEAIVLNPQFSTTYLFFSNKNEVWQNGNVRKALALLLPWEEIRSSQMMPGSTLIPAIPYYPAAEGIKNQNLEQAMLLLKQEGYEKGKGLPPIKIRMPVSDDMSRIGELMKNIWEENLGVEVSIESVNYPHYYNALKGDDYTIGALTWIGDYADPMTFLEMWLRSSSLNDAAYSNIEYDKKISDSSAGDFGERYKIMSEAETMLLDSAQVMPLGHSPAINIIDLRFIDGWYPNVLDIHPFKYLKFKSGFSIPGTV
ncbi:MAG: peptide ABC transporter substrate-binding protein, partial [Spirochaetaceae bacterium]|nr:peptide ABC transporter substrate-binding protein [Spirochaetaceae bacterium]